MDVDVDVNVNAHAHAHAHVNAHAHALVVVLALFGCKPSPPPPPPSVLPTYDGAVVVYPHPAKCEVEISGRIVVARDAPPPRTFVAVGDCLAEGANVIGTGGTTGGGFFIEVFAPWGSDLTLCAASEPSPGAPSRLYGKAKQLMHAEAAGEVTFHDVVVELQPGPPRTFPRGY